jgi:hypothetical protein
VERRPKRPSPFTGILVPEERNCPSGNCYNTHQWLDASASAVGSENVRLKIQFPHANSTLPSLFLAYTASAQTETAYSTEMKSVSEGPISIKTAIVANDNFDGQNGDQQASSDPSNRSRTSGPHRRVTEIRPPPQL